MANVIVVGYDGTDGGNAALGASTELAKELGAELVITFAYEPSRFPDESGDYEAAVKELGERVTREALGKLETEGVKAEAELVPTRPADALVKVADERDARLIAVGTHGERPLAGLVVGSTPYKLLNLSEPPLLVVRA